MFIYVECVHIRRGECHPRFPHTHLTFTPTTVCLNVWPQSVLSDHFDNHLITGLPPLDHYLCTPSPLMYKFWVPLCPYTCLTMPGDIFNTLLQLLWWLCAKSWSSVVGWPVFRKQCL